MSGRLFRTGLLASLFAALTAGVVLVGIPLASAQEPSPTPAVEEEPATVPDVEDSDADTDEAAPSDDTDKAPSEDGRQRDGECDKDRDGTDASGASFRGGGGDRL